MIPTQEHFFAQQEWNHAKAAAALADTPLRVRLNGALRTLIEAHLALPLRFALSLDEETVREHLERLTTPINADRITVQFDDDAGRTHSRALWAGGGDVFTLLDVYAAIEGIYADLGPTDHTFVEFIDFIPQDHDDDSYVVEVRAGS